MSKILIQPAKKNVETVDLNFSIFQCPQGTSSERFNITVREFLFSITLWMKKPLCLALNCNFVLVFGSHTTIDLLIFFLFLVEFFPKCRSKCEFWLICVWNSSFFSKFISLNSRCMLMFLSKGKIFIRFLYKLLWRRFSVGTAYWFGLNFKRFWWWCVCYLLIIILINLVKMVVIFLFQSICSLSI